MPTRVMESWRNTGTLPDKSYYAAGALVSSAAFANTGNLAIDKIYAFPYRESKVFRYDEIDVKNDNASATAVCRIGIYKADNAPSGDLMPVSLELDSGEISLSTAVVHTVSIDWLSDSNSLYWIVLHPGVDVRNFDGFGQSDCWPVFGRDSNNDPVNGIVVDQAYGALPAVFPVTGLVRYSPTNIPQLRLRPSDIA